MTAYRARTHGAAVERTRLAWQRSGLSLVGLRAAHRPGRPVERWGRRAAVRRAVRCSLLGLAAWAIGLRQERVRAKRIGTPRDAAVLSDLAPVAIGTFLIGLAGLVVELLFVG